MIVFDSSPLILLAKTELLELFLNSFPETAAVPDAVQKECCGITESFDARLIAQLIKEKRLVVQKLKGRTLYNRIRTEFSLGRGESEAIALAQQLDATLIAIEDRSGVNACKLLRLPFIGVLGILIRLREKRVITTEQALRKLETLIKFGRYSQAIIEDVRHRLEETK